MKKLIAGSIFIISGIMLFCIAYIPCSNYIISLGQWNTPPGKFLTSIINTGGTLPFILGITLLLLGIVFVLWGTFEK